MQPRFARPCALPPGVDEILQFTGVQPSINDVRRDRERRKIPCRAGAPRACGRIPCSVVHHRGRGRRQGCSPAVAANRWRRGRQPVGSPTGITKSGLNAAATGTGVKGPASHSLRHSLRPFTGCSHRLNVNAVSAWLGHSEPDRHAQHLPGVGAGHLGRHQRGSLTASRMRCRRTAA